VEQSRRNVTESDPSSVFVAKPKTVTLFDVLSHVRVEAIGVIVWQPRFAIIQTKRIEIP
jgi:hypothetical protein